MWSNVSLPIYIYTFVLRAQNRYPPNMMVFSNFLPKYRFICFESYQNTPKDCNKKQHISHHQTNLENWIKILYFFVSGVSAGVVVYVHADVGNIKYKNRRVMIQSIFAEENFRRNQFFTENHLK
jgi:hypothetical protein